MGLLDLYKTDPKEKSQAAYINAERVVVAEANQRFQDNYSSLREALYKLNLKEKPSDAELNGMVRDLIMGVKEHPNVRGFNAIDESGNKIFINLSEVDAELKNSEAGQKILASHKVDSISKIIPTEKQVAAIAGAVRDATSEELQAGNRAYALASATFSSATTVELLAQRISASAAKKLEALAEKDSDLAIHLPKTKINEIKDGIEKTVIAEANGETATVADNADIYKFDFKGRPFKSADETIIESKRQGAQSEIFNTTKEEAYNTILAGIEEEKKKTKNGLMGFLFAILDFFGFGNMFDPSNDDVQMASQQVAKTISNTLTAKDFRDANGKTIPQMSPEELKVAINSELTKSLAANKANYSSFSDENLAEIAAKASEKVTAPENLTKLAEIPKSIYATPPTTENSTPTATMEAAKAACSTKLHVQECTAEQFQTYQQTPAGKPQIIARNP